MQRRWNPSAASRALVPQQQRRWGQQQLQLRQQRGGLLPSTGSAAPAAALVESLRALLWLHPSRPSLGGAGGRRGRARAKSPGPQQQQQEQGGSLAPSAAPGAVAAALSMGIGASSSPLAGSSKQSASAVGGASADSPTGNAPPAATRRRRKSRASSGEQQRAPLTADANVTMISIDVGEVLHEWRRLQCHGNEAAAAGPHTDSSSGRSGIGKVTASSSVFVSEGHLHHPPSEASIADRAAAMSTILKHPEVYPQLHTLFFFDKETDGVGEAKADKDAVAEQFDLSLAGVSDVVRAEEDLVTLLSVMRVYRQLSRQSAWMAKVIRRISETILSDLSAAWLAELAHGATSRSADREAARKSVKRSVSLVLLELHKGHFRQAQVLSHANGTALPSEKQPRTHAQRPRQKAQDGGEWPAAATEAFLATTVASIADHIAAAMPTAAVEGGAAADDSGREAGQLTELLNDYVLLVLAADASRAAAPEPNSAGKGDSASASASASAVSAAAAWGAASEKAEKRVEMAFATYSALTSPGRPSPSPLKKGGDGVDECRRRVGDLLDALLLALRFDLAVPHRVRHTLHANAVRVLLELSQAIQQRPPLFHALCCQSFARALGQLQEAPGNLYDQLCNNTFSAAAAFLTASTATDITLLVDAQEALCRASVGGGVAVEAVPRPPLHSTLSQLCYALLCTGFAPEAVLGSGLCVSLSAGDLADITNASALFSVTFAAGPLPVRVHAALFDEAVALAKRALVLSQRAVRTATDMLMSETAGLVPLEVSVEAGGAAAAAQTHALRPGTPPRERTMTAAKRVKYLKKLKKRADQQREGGGSGSGGSNSNASTRALDEATTATGRGASEGEGESVGLAVGTREEADLATAQAYYVCVAALVEGLSRGDAIAVSRVGQSLLPLLELDGSATYLVEALELVTARVRSRLATAGRLESPLASAVAAATAAAATPQTAVRAASRKTTTMAMEQGFVDVACAFQARLSDNILRRVLKVNAASSLGGRTGSGARGVPPPVTSVGSGGSRSTEVAAAMGKEGVEELVRLVYRFTVCVLTFGMKASFYEQLLTLHTSLRTAHTALSPSAGGSGGGSADAKSEAAAARDALQTVKQLDLLMDGLVAARLPMARHPQSAHVRSSDTVLNKIIALQLHATAGVAAALGNRQNLLPPAVAAAAAAAVDGDMVKRQRSFVLSVVHLLHRLAADHPVEAEPAKLRAFRTNILEPAISSVLASPKNSAGDALPLGTLAEVAAVLCVPRTIHHVSQSLYEGLSVSVVQVAAASAAGTSPSHPRTQPPTQQQQQQQHSPAASHTAQRILCAAAAICLRADPVLTSLYLDMATVLEPWLNLKQTIQVLNTALEMQVPPTAPPVVSMLRRLNNGLAAAVVGTAGEEVGEGRSPTPSPATVKKAPMGLGDMVTILCTLCHYDGQMPASAASAAAAPPPTAATAYSAATRKGSGGKKGRTPEQGPLDVPYGAVFLHLCRPETTRRRALSLQQCGNLVQVAVAITRRPLIMARLDDEERECVERVPRVMAVPVLRAPQHGIEHDIPAIVSGYAAVADAQLRAQVMRAFISRTIRACPSQTPEEVVACVEAYCTAGIYHEYLFSVLLGRVADVTQTFSLALSLRLLRCGVAAGNEQVRMACLTAAQPVFVGHVRHVLQSDPQQLATVGATSTTILACLRTCFPHDPVSAAVLDTIATYHKSAGLAVVMAALELVAARGSKDYAVLRSLADHCTNELMRSCTVDDLADLTYLLVLCGVRSSSLVQVATERFREGAVASEVGGYALARLALALETAAVDVDESLIDASVQRVTELVDNYLDAIDNAKARSHKAETKAKSTTTMVAAEPPPFTALEAVHVLRHMRTAGRHHFALVVPAVDALLACLAAAWATREITTTRGGDDAEPTQAPDAFGVESLSLSDIEVILSACVDQASEPRRHALVVLRCAARLVDILAPSPPPLASQDKATPTGGQGGGGSNDPAPPPVSQEALRADLSLLTSLASHLVRASTSASTGKALTPSTPAFRAAQLLFAILYEKRGTLLKRHLLLHSTQQTLATAGKEVHPRLFALVVEKKLM